MSIIAIACRRTGQDNDNKTITFGKRNWIAVSKLDNNPNALHRKCTIVTPELISEIPKLEIALKGADGCVDETEICAIPSGISIGTVYDGWTVGDWQDYELSVSKEEAEKIAGLTDIQQTAILAYNDNFYLLAFQTTDSDVQPQIITKFLEPVAWHPVALEKEQLLNYTLVIKTGATFGESVEINLDAQASARDSGLDIRFEPEHFVIQERSEVHTNLIITTNSDARDGIYDIRAIGKANNSSLFSLGGFGRAYPVIQIGGSPWQIFNYGTNSGFGMYGKDAPEWLRMELRTDKQSYAEGEPVQFEVYIINDGQEKAMLESSSRFVIQLFNKDTNSNYVYEIDSILDSNATITVEPKSRVLLARPFQWDQKTFDDPEKPYNVVAGNYLVDVSLMGYEGYVFHYQTEIQIGTVEKPHNNSEFKGIAITIPKGASETQGGPYFVPAVASVPAGTEFRWNNDDLLPHTATSGTPSSGNMEQLFDTGIIKPRYHSEPFTIDEPGTYQYFCLLHPWMTGSIEVEQP